MTHRQGNIMPNENALLFPPVHLGLRVNTSAGED